MPPRVRGVVRQLALEYGNLLAAEAGMQESARGVLLTPSGLVLLLRVATQTGHLWITPGGRIQPGEDGPAAAIREIREETGHQDLSVGAEIWVRHASYFADGQWLPERERFFLVPTDEFEPTARGMEPEERARHGGFRWWAIDEIEQSPEAFAPRKLAELLRNLQQRGPASSPVECGE